MILQYTSMTMQVKLLKPHPLILHVVLAHHHLMSCYEATACISLTLAQYVNKEPHVA